MATAEGLLLSILENFPQADPSSKYFNEEINGPQAVDFISEIVPEIRTFLNEQTTVENEAINALEAAWDFIENVTQDDPQRNDKFFAQRERVRNVLWGLRQQQQPIVAVVVEGGLVQCLTSNWPDAVPPVTFMVIDYDTEGCDKDEMVAIPQGDGTVENAYAKLEALGKAEIDLEAVLKQLKEEE